ncbi:MAG: hypothetical protein AAFY17_02490 [Cyanobacteria bacterium J06642_11]
MNQGLASPYLIQDDARHYLFWMERFRHPAAFPNDLIADYLQSIAPVGYKLFFGLVSHSGISIEWFAKVLPMVLGGITAAYYYRLVLAVLPLPLVGVMATVMLNQTLWCTDDLSTASPRAFIYPLLVPLLFYFVRRLWWQSLGCLGLLALFYPPVALVAMTLYVLHGVNWRAVAWRLTHLSIPGGVWFRVWHRKRWPLIAIAITITALSILPTYLSSQTFGPVATMAQALDIPEYQPQGRHSFFAAGLSRYTMWLFGGHGSLVKRTIFTPITLIAALLLPVIVKCKFRSLQQVSPQTWVFAKLIGAGLIWFLLAYGLAFRLHMPGRYTSHCISLVMPLLAAITWMVLLEWIWEQIRPQLLCALITLSVLIPLLFYYPLLLNNFPKPYYISGQAPAVYEYLHTQPQDTVVASIDNEANNIPSFAKRSTVIAAEYGTPFHLGYYGQFRQRAQDLLMAHYTNNHELLNDVTRRYDIDLWLIHKGAFHANYLIHHSYWSHNYADAVAKTLAQMQTESSILQKHVTQCTVLDSDRFWLVDAHCAIK